MATRLEAHSSQRWQIGAQLQLSCHRDMRGTMWMCRGEVETV